MTERHSSPGYGPTVLVVDDDPIFRTMLERFLEREGMQVHTAEDGKSGVQYALETRPDLVLMDAQMPELDGIEACRQIKEAFPDADVQVLMVTANSDDSLIEAAFSAGASDYITKPINWTLLRHRVQFELKLASHFKALRNSEARFRFLFEQAPVAYAVLSASGKILQSNPALHQLVGSAQILDHALCQFIQDEDCPQFQEYLHGLMKGHQQIDGHVLTLKPANEAAVPVYVRLTASVTPAVSSRHLEILCVLEDVTDTVLTTRNLEQQVVTDPLTGLLNRRAFEQALRLHLLNSARTSSPLTLVMLDIDYFKKVNDQHGHVVGDQVLRHLGTLIQQALHREQDRAYRLGGEEFALLLPDTSIEGGCRVAERLRSLLEQTPAPTDDGLLSFTISAGVACTNSDQPEVESLYRAADAALYAAKQAGRNRVFSCNADTPAPCMP